MDRDGRELKSRDKKVLKHSKDGLLEKNLSKKISKKVSNKIEDIDLEKHLEDKKIESIDLSRPRRKVKEGKGRPKYKERVKNKKTNKEKTLDKETYTSKSKKYDPIEVEDREEAYDLPPINKEASSFSDDGRELEDSVQDKEDERDLIDSKTEDGINIDESYKRQSGRAQGKKFKRAIEDFSGSKKEGSIKKKDLEHTKEEFKGSTKKKKNKKTGKKSKEQKFKHEKAKNNKFSFEETKKLDKEDSIFKDISSKTVTGLGLIGGAGKKIYDNQMDEMTDENQGTEASHKGIKLGESLVKKSKNYRESSQHKKLKKENKDLVKRSRLQEKSKIKQVLNKDKKYQEAKGVNKYVQKWKIKRSYQKRNRKTIIQSVTEGIKSGPKAIKNIIRRTGKKAGAYLIALVFLLLLIMVTLQSCSNILLGGLGSIVGTSYQSSDLEVTEADIEYTKLEAELLLTLQDIEVDNSAYDEYRYNLDGVGHDPHELIAYLTAKYGDFSLSQIRGELKAIFAGQYELSLQEIVETYTVTETYTDPETGEIYEEEVEYEKHILLTTLVTRPMGEVLVERLSNDEKDLYDILMTSKGNFMSYSSPVEGDWKSFVTSMFGWRIHPIHKTENFHKGIDIGKGEGEDLYAIFDGRVDQVAYDGNGYGHYLIIEDKLGNKALYAHCSSIDVARGAEVEAGELIGRIGSSGASTGPHLHLELEDKDGNSLNPYFYLYSESNYIGNGTYYNGYTGNYGNPGIAYDDEAVRNLFNEADKHLGKRYVFGANGPNNFDCSSFVCWTFRISGTYNISRTTAQGIFNMSAPISPSEAKAGDIIFFTGTYNSGGPVSHVGIYAGNGMMVHAGDPIQYTSIESNYWKNHFYSFGRLK